MTSRPSRLGSANYETETNWAESTDTFGTRLEVLGEPVLPSDIQMRIAEPITQQYAEEGKLGVRGPWQGQFTIELALTGHGGTTVGSLTETDLCTLLENFFGGKNVAQAGDSALDTVTSATLFTTSGTVVSGALVRIGVLGDGRAEGQFYPILAAGSTTLSVAMDTVATTADALYAAQMIYPLESASTMAPVTSTRWLLQTANGQWKARGCFPMSASFSGLNVGEQPRVSLTYGVSRWEEANETFPDATATDAKDGMICAAGSFNLQDEASTVRRTFNVRNWSLDISMETTPLLGPGGQDSYQTIVDAVRTRCAATVSVTIDAEASGTNTLNDIYANGTIQHLLASCSVADGKALGFYFPYLRPTGYVTQVAMDGLNRRTINFEALTDAAASGDLRLSSWRMAMG